MAIPDDARFKQPTDPQSRKEDVAYDWDVQAESLAKEKEKNGWAHVDEYNGKYPAPAPTAGTRGTADEEAGEADSTHDEG